MPTGNRTSGPVAVDPPRLFLTGLRWRRLHFASVGEVDHRLQDYLSPRLDAVTHLDLRSKIARDRHFVEVRGPVLVHGHLYAIAVEYDGIRGNQNGRSLARDMQ